MNKEEILKEIEKYKEQIKNLEDKLKESKVWKPKNNEKIWFIDGNGNIHNDNWLDWEINGFYSIGNCYKTKEEAEKALEIKKIDTELRRYAIEHNEEEIDWEDERQVKWLIVYDNYEEEIDFSRTCIWQYYGPCFTSKEIAENAIKEIGEDRVKLWCKGE